MSSHQQSVEGSQGRVRLTGDLTAEVVPELQTSMRQMLADQVQHLEIDLEQTVMLDSCGIGLLIATSNSLRRAGGTLRIAGVRPEIFRLLQSMRLVQRLNIVPLSAKKVSDGR